MTTAQPGQEQRMENARDMLIRRRKDAESLGGSAEIATEELDAAIAALTRPTASTSGITDAMIEAGAAELWHTLELSEEAIEDLRADGNLEAAARRAYTAMHAARPTADLGDDGEVAERLSVHADNEDRCGRHAAADLCRQAADRLILYREARDQVEQVISAWAFAHNIDGALRNDLFKRLRSRSGG